MSAPPSGGGRIKSGAVDVVAVQVEELVEEGRTLVASLLPLSSSSLFSLDKGKFEEEDCIGLYRGSSILFLLLVSSLFRNEIGRRNCKGGAAACKKKMSKYNVREER